MLRRVLVRLQQGKDFREAYAKRFEDLETTDEFLFNRLCLRNYLRSLHGARKDEFKTER